MTPLDLAWCAAGLLLFLVALACIWAAVDFVRRIRAERRRQQVEVLRLLALGPKYLDEIPWRLRPAIHNLSAARMITVASYSESGSPKRLLCMLTTAGRKRLETGAEQAR